MISNGYIRKILDSFYACGKLDKQYTIVFVYNDAKNTDCEHITESITPIELKMIIGSFQKICQNVYYYDSELSFLYNIEQLKREYKYILVYSMAQNLRGVGRRALVPLLCKYFNLINISSGELASFLSGNKQLMNLIITNSQAGFRIPFSLYVNVKDIDSKEKITAQLEDGKYIIKPIDESASIGVTPIELTTSNRSEIYEYIMKYSRTYPFFHIQEFIDGDEVEVPLFKLSNDYFCPGVCQIVFDEDISFLDYDTVGLDAYSFALYKDNNSRVIEAAVRIADTLQFYTLSRIDFRIKDGIPYVIDIGANPTISYHSSTNFLFRSVFDNESSVYHLLVVIALIKNGLFKPPLD